jgi:class 3 adenylate cyclase
MQNAPSTSGTGAMISPPTGTITFLFTDMEGSTRLWELHADAVRAALVRNDALVEEIVQSYGGIVASPRGEGGAGVLPTRVWEYPQLSSPPSPRR